ncbi:hypothetical protein FLA_0574 [Filimonas lacunae]|nr:hypothetical protein FLA_0574 [Filimonas lacunae]
MPADETNEIDTVITIPPVDTTPAPLYLVKLQQDFTLSGGSKESNTTNITWDSNKKITSYAVSGVANGTDISLKYRFDRNSSGKLIAATESNFPTASGYDSIVHKVFYKSGTEQLAYVTSFQYASGFVLNDSIVYTYDVNGYVSQKETYWGLAGMLQKYSRETYTYDGSGNLTKQVIAAWDGSSTYVSSSTLTYTYSTHKTMLKLGVEAFVVPLPSLSSPNYYSEYVQRTENSTFTNDYINTTYNVNDMPVTGTVTRSGTGIGSAYNGSASFVCTYIK